MSHSITDNHLLIYVKHVKAVKEDINVRFQDLLYLEVFPWSVKPFTSNINECDSTMQEMLIDLQSDKEAREIFRAYGWAGFWINCNDRFSELWEKINLFSIGLSNHIYC